jgi:hypothetical protein
MGNRNSGPVSACLPLRWTSALLLRTLLGKNLGAKLDALIADVDTGSRDQPFDLALALAAERAQQLISKPFTLSRLWCRILHMAPRRPNDCEMRRPVLSVPAPNRLLDLDLLGSVVLTADPVIPREAHDLPVALHAHQ